MRSVNSIALNCKRKQTVYSNVTRTHNASLKIRNRISPCAATCISFRTIEAFLGSRTARAELGTGIKCFVGENN